MSHAAPLLTVFAIPKPFAGATAVHQHNAIRSWKSLGPDVEVILCGDERGVADAARQHGALVASDIARNRHGTPLVSAAFEAAAALSRAPLLCYANADIILMSDFVQMLSNLRLTKFLVCGRRWDVDVDACLAFETPRWEDDLRSLVRARGRLHAPEAMDFFVFPRGFVHGMPPFAVGRAMWDNWLVFYARAQGAAVVDATADTMVVHQNHDYAHVKGGQMGAWHGAEARANRALAAAMLYPFTVVDATLILKEERLVRLRGVSACIRRAQSGVALSIRSRPALVRLLRRILRAKA